MRDLPTLSKKPRAIHPRQRGHTHKPQQQHQPQQHQRQPNAMYFPPLPNNLTKSLIDDGLPKGSDFPEKPERLEEQFGREQFPLNDNPQFVKSLDYSLMPEYNKWCPFTVHHSEKTHRQENLGPLVCASCDSRLFAGPIAEFVETQKPLCESKEK